MRTRTVKKYWEEYTKNHFDKDIAKQKMNNFYYSNDELKQNFMKQNNLVEKYKSAQECFENGYMTEDIYQDYINAPEEYKRRIEKEYEIIPPVITKQQPSEPEEIKLQREANELARKQWKFRYKAIIYSIIGGLFCTIIGYVLGKFL